MEEETCFISTLTYIESEHKYKSLWISFVSLAIFLSKALSWISFPFPVAKLKSAQWANAPAENGSAYWGLSLFL
jgi:hypothetical protein